MHDPIYNVSYRAITPNLQYTSNNVNLCHVTLTSFDFHS